MTTPPQSDTVVEVSETMKALVDDLASKAFAVGDARDQDGEPYTKMQTTRLLSVAKAPLLREIARLEDAFSALQYIHTRYGRLDGVGWDRVGIAKENPHAQL